jgi:hypothetical protein
MKKRRYPDMPTKGEMPLMLWDMGIEDKEERKLKALPFMNAREAADFLGHEKTQTVTKMIDKIGKYVYGRDKTWAARTVKK